jgi:ABC-type polysaccharide/polyol phosphate transport system ATPase subunit
MFYKGFIKLLINDLKINNRIAIDEVIISLDNVSKMYLLFEKPIDRLKHTLFSPLGKKYGREFWALQNISFNVKRGETIGILGRNGSGKSTLLQIIAGVLQPSEGFIKVKGRVSALLELGSGFNPEYSGRENVFMGGAIMGMDRQEMNNRYSEIVSFADIGSFIDQPVKTYSSGMMMRLAFSVASCVRPDVLIVDEALAVGDIMFQAKCFEKIKSLRENGVTTIFVTHDYGLVQNLCTYGYILDGGKIFSQGKPDLIAMQYYQMMRETEQLRVKLNELKSSKEKENALRETKERLDEIKNKDSKQTEYRFGTSGAVITQYRFENEKGEESTRLETGKKFHLNVKIQFHEIVHDLSIAVFFRNIKGENIMVLHTYYRDEPLKFGAFFPNECVEFTFSQIMRLHPGDYLLAIALADQKTDTEFISLDYRSNIDSISVFGPKPRYSGLFRIESNIGYRKM